MVILSFNELLHLFMTYKGICINIADRHIKKGKPRAARFAVSTDVRCRSEKVLTLIILSILFEKGEPILCCVFFSLTGNNRIS